ncbi:MAG TPA: hypothetical protein VKB86_16405 [Pyrinomonadaceae bacterium]|nr:hypothetical protein [Pyrinomonadaceae bacterium]
MKKLIQLLVFAALLTAFALPALAQTTPANNSGSASAAQDDTEAKAKLYDQFRTNIKDHPDVAYQAGKDYLAKYEAKDGPDDQYVKYIKKWVTSYEKIARRQELINQLTSKQVDTAFTSARTVLTDYPDDLGLLYDLARAGFAAATSGNKNNNADTITYAKRAIQLLQSGKSFDPNKPLSEQEKNSDIGLLNYGLGLLTQDTSPAEATTYFINAAQTGGDMKKDPNIYALLYQIYAKNDYTKLKADYEASCKTDEQLNSQACKDLTAKVNQTVDRMIDALARAIAYADASPKSAEFAQYRTAWMSDLTGFYKYRSGGSDTGLKELLASITSRPIPKPGEAINPPLFPQTSPTTPSSGAATTPGSTTGTATTTTTTPKTTTPATNTKTTNSTSTQPNKTTTTQPTGKTTSKSSPRRAH